MLKSALAQSPHRASWMFPQSSGAFSFNEQRKFAGKEFDKDTQLSYFGARYYDSSVGRGTNPEREVEILALPVSGPWMKIGEAIDYALLLKSKAVFPVHDAIRFGSVHTFPERLLGQNGIHFFPMIEGDIREF